MKKTLKTPIFFGILVIGAAFLITITTIITMIIRNQLRMFQQLKRNLIIIMSINKPMNVQLLLQQAMLIFLLFQFNLKIKLHSTQIN